MPEFCLIVEDRADAEIAAHLAERVLVEKLDWLEASHVEHIFTWSGLEEITEYSQWLDMGRIIEQFKQRGLRIPKYLGHGRDGSFKADGAISMKALHLVEALRHKMNRPIAAVCLIRDVDNQPERRIGLEQARGEHAERQPDLIIVIGTPNRNREAWVLNGFVPSSSEEIQSLEDMTRKLGFHPCEEAHRLRSNSFAEPERLRNPKVALESLTGGDRSRERQCWEETDLNRLRFIGTHTGLADYLREVEQRLLPLISKTSE
jgi:hypothetical protein